jgi:hypothetical protein
MTAPPSSGSLLRWISHQRAMSCRTRLRVDWDLGTLPVNVRTRRAPSLSMIRQCRKATSEGSSFLSAKSTLNIGLGLVSVILPPPAPRPSLGAVYPKRGLDEPGPWVCNLAGIPTLAISCSFSTIRFCGGWRHFPTGHGGIHICCNRGGSVNAEIQCRRESGGFN